MANSPMVILSRVLESTVRDHLTGKVGKSTFGSSAKIVRSSETEFEIRYHDPFDGKTVRKVTVS